MPAQEKFIAFVKQAFRKEYNRHRKNFPAGRVGDMGASIQVAHLYFPKLWQKVMGVVEEQTEKIQCMNEGAKMRVGCMVLAEAGFEVAPALLTGGGTLALALVMKAKKGEKLGQVFDAPKQDTLLVSSSPSRPKGSKEEIGQAADNSRVRENKDEQGRLREVKVSEEARLKAKGLVQYIMPVWILLSAI